MALIVLTTICSLACLFLLFVLYQWMRETKRKTTTRPAVGNEADETRETKQPHIVGARKAVERRDRSGVRSHRADAATEPLRAGVRRAPAERLREDREIVQTRKEKPGEKNADFQMEEFVSLMLVGVFCGSAVSASAFADDDGKDQPRAKPAAAVKIEAPAPLTERKRQLLDRVEQLEKRMAELEGKAQPTAAPAPANSDSSAVRSALEPSQDTAAVGNN